MTKKMEYAGSFLGDFREDTLEKEAFKCCSAIGDFDQGKLWSPCINFKMFLLLLLHSDCQSQADLTALSRKYSSCFN